MKLNYACKIKTLFKVLESYLVLVYSCFPYQVKTHGVEA